MQEMTARGMSALIRFVSYYELRGFDRARRKCLEYSKWDSKTLLYERAGELLSVYRTQVCMAPSFTNTCHFQGLDCKAGNWNFMN